MLLSDLAVRLRGQDLQVVERHGASDARIDLAVGVVGGALLVAVESDGPGYAAVTSSRERDRLRSEQLERLGWRHLRVWSTDVFRDPAREVARIRTAVGRASSATAATAPPAQAPVASSGPPVRWDGDELAHTGSGTSPGQRVGQRPRVPSGLPIDDYTEADLDAVVGWICSDTLLRTHDEVAALTRQQLGFSRRGSRIDAAVDAAITRVRTGGGS
jgi:hypothetical protein